MYFYVFILEYFIFLKIHIYVASFHVSRV